MHTRGDESESAGGRMGDAAARLAEDTAELARREVRAIQDEAVTALRRFGAGGLLLAGAGTCGVLALWAAHETLLRAVESVLPREKAAVALTCAYAGGAAALGMAARNRIRAGAQATAGAMEKEAGQLEQEHAPMRGGEDAGS
ncbi:MULTISPECIES: phage holin family protein [unclassified Streptomyces]|uniref:phage holin family protein n=1 Tax=unclassified Streptomyces TaxID=2593676 RepID=UPI001488D5C1|nr:MULTISPECIES: phage holin family protein [unclassified Streptomyces]